MYFIYLRKTQKSELSWLKSFQLSTTWEAGVLVLLVLEVKFGNQSFNYG